jgi:hypothetical protein
MTDGKHYTRNGRHLRTFSGKLATGCCPCLLTTSNAVLIVPDGPTCVSNSHICSPIYRGLRLGAGSCYYEFSSPYGPTYSQVMLLYRGGSWYANGYNVCNYIWQFYGGNVSLPDYANSCLLLPDDSVSCLDGQLQAVFELPWIASNNNACPGSVMQVTIG